MRLPAAVHRVLPAFLFFLLAACGGVGGGGPGGGQPLQPQAGKARGRVTTQGGQPLADVLVRAFGTTLAGDDTVIEGETDAQGTYSLTLPDGVWGLAAYTEVAFDGREYLFTLEPGDGKTGISHDSAPGIVKDFVWKLSGLKPDAPEGSREHTDYYGGYVPVEAHGSFRKGPELEGTTLKLVFTPASTRVDGSEGEVRSFTHAFAAGDRNLVADGTSVELGWEVMDIPGATYTVSAFLEMGGVGQVLKLTKSYDGELSDTVTVDLKGLNLHATAFGDFLYVGH